MPRKSFFLILLAIALFSCKTSKDLTYLKDMSDQELQDHLPKKPAEYRIKENDNLYVKIVTQNAEVNNLFSQNPVSTAYLGNQQQSFSDPSNQFINGNIVDQKGEITLPILGKIKVEGFTVSEAQDAIHKKAEEYLKDYIVQVKLMSFKITMLGEFRSPGVIYNYNNNFTVLEAISRAGGVTDYSKLNQIMVIRPTPAGYKSFKLDLSSEKLLTSEAFYLQPDDLVYAGPDKNKNISLNATTYSLLLSSITTLLVIMQFFRF
ncbi:MAG: polysaccharide biosynthesis/export family protein [Prolixibacteraceae bacterium]|jgi:polysaccharide export outer membrane protein|nr:polysaccharide biosynthesis/export family protein [Prolixibacteraceae bacterium]